MPRLRLVLPLALALLACAEDPQPRAAYDAEPVRTLAPAELGDAGEVEGFAVGVIREGRGPVAERGNWVRVHYIVEPAAGGAPIDSSHGDKPLLFRLGDDGSVIEGLHAGVLGMKVGELRRITVPPKLGYRGRKLPGMDPEASLLFLVELVEVKAGP